MNPRNCELYKELPINHQAVANIRNRDKFCSTWSISAGKFPAKTNQNSASSYKHHFGKVIIFGLVLVLD